MFLFGVGGGIGQIKICALLMRQTHIPMPHILYCLLPITLMIAINQSLYFAKSKKSWAF